ncbi:glycerol-3-phosphate responsive antiterminator [Ruminococcaceae bacterium OttesenSCG-928-A16]|nr:glycerol-3-phosphate responsive antiterminator [Ruminococcaceae bacterium OttesenSCG-928-A16]
MNSTKIIAQLAETPVVAAVKDAAGLARCLASNAPVVFVLHGSIVDIADTVGQIHKAGKAAIVHIDLIDGLAPREVAVDYIAQTTKADGIISTKPALVKHAKATGLVAIRRFFLLDSLALQSLEKQLTPDAADFIEILPGCMPKIIQKIVIKTTIPVIAGGLISDKEDVVSALNAGATAVSSTNPAVWNL